MQAESDRHLRFALLCPLLLAITGALYWPATQGPFQFDDYNVIANNPATHSLHAWLASMPGIRPLLKLSYTLNWIADGEPFGFHLLNIVIHLVNTALVYSLLCKLSTAQSHSLPISVAGAALFALHPAQTEAVTYICGRSVALMSVFYLLSLRCGIADKQFARHLSPAFFLCALLTKENAWTAPFALLLIECARGKAWRKTVVNLWPQWATLLAGTLALLAIADYRALLRHSLAIRSIAENLQLQIAGQFYLLTQPLLLLQTTIDPDIGTSPALLLAQGLALLALLLLGAWQWRRGRRWIGFGIVWFFLHLLPTNSLLPRNDIANDRQLYLALIGPAFVLATWIFRRWGDRRGAPVVAAIALVLMFATYVRNRDYDSEIALWQATAQYSPAKARVWNNLGYAHQQSGNFAAARAAYSRALALDPLAVRARINLRLLDDSAPAQTSDGSPAGK